MNKEPDTPPSAELREDPMHSAQKRVPPSSQPGNTGGGVGESAGMRMLLPVGRSGWAIAAGYLGLLSLFLLPAPVAVVVSIVAVLDIKKSKNAGKPKHGMGRAVFGLVAGTAGTILLATMIVGWMRFAAEVIRSSS